MGPLRILALCYIKVQYLLTYGSPRWFPFLSVTIVIKLECVHRAASHAFIDYLSSSPIPPLHLLEVSLSPLQVTLTHFTLSSCDQAIRLPTSFFISCLARLGMKPWLSQSSRRAFGSTHLLTLSPSSPREILFETNLPFFLGTCLPSPWS